jgi:hypothetical protein
MTAAQISKVSSGAFGAMSSSQLQSVFETVTGITAAQLSSLSQDQCKGITATQIGRLSTAQISALKSFDWLSADAFAGLTAEQIKFVSTGGVVGGSWHYMTAPQISKLTPAAFGAMSS